MYGINYDGLRKRKSYDQLLVDIENQPKIIYPDRTAKFLRNSPIISNLLDGDISYLTENENRRKLLTLGFKIPEREGLYTIFNNAPTEVFDMAAQNLQNQQEAGGEFDVEAEADEAGESEAEEGNPVVDPNAGTALPGVTSGGDASGSSGSGSLQTSQQAESSNAVLTGPQGAGEIGDVIERREEEKEEERKKIARETKIKLQEEKIKQIEKEEEQENIEGKNLIFEIFRRARVQGKTIEDNFLIFADNYLSKKDKKSAAEARPENRRRNIAKAIKAIKEPKNITLDYSKFNDGRSKRETKIKLQEEKIKQIEKEEEQENIEGKNLIFEIFKRARVQGKTIEDNFLIFADNYLSKKDKKSAAEARPENRRRNIAKAIKAIKEPKNITLDYSKFNDGRSKRETVAPAKPRSTSRKGTRRETEDPEGLPRSLPLQSAQEGGASSSTSGIVDTTPLERVSYTIEKLEKRLHEIAKGKNWPEDFNIDPDYWNEPGVETKKMQRTVPYIRYQLLKYHNIESNEKLKKLNAVEMIIRAITEKKTKQSP